MGKIKCTFETSKDGKSATITIRNATGFLTNGQMYQGLLNVLEAYKEMAEEAPEESNSNVEN